jgi:hypothetical protein
MSTIILGSRPAPRIPTDARAVIYANASVFHHSEVERLAPGVKQRHHVLSNSLLTDVNAACLEARLCLQDQRLDRTMIIEFRPTDLEQVSFEELNYHSADARRITRADKEQVTRSVLGRGFLRGVLKAPSPLSAKLGFARHYIRTREMHLSTGLLALLYAIDADLPAPYVLCGIGLTNAGYAHTKTPALRGHQLNDAVALKLLLDGTRAVSLTTTEPELTNLAGVPLYKGKATVL